MSDTEKAIVGKKGEIYTRKRLRDLAGIEPGDEILIEASPGELRIRKILSLQELLELPKISSGTVEEIERDIEETFKGQESLSAKDLDQLKRQKS
ncbi:MAG: AbrB/MazE/SpoVT family DNA-binding domain-containing protein [Candidatus Hodarchaeales archaeon]